METTKLSSKGQIIIPKDVRERKQWKPGQEFEVEETESGVLLRPRSPFPTTRLEDVGSSFHYSGPTVPVERLSIGALPYRDSYEAENDDDRS